MIYDSPASLASLVYWIFVSYEYADVYMMYSQIKCQYWYLNGKVNM